MTHHLRCAWCDSPFVARISTTLYCTESCRQKAYRQRRRVREPNTFTEVEVVTVLGEVLPSHLDDMIDVITEKLRSLR
mgnify:CR=1 FL=1